MQPETVQNPYKSLKWRHLWMLQLQRDNRDHKGNGLGIGVRKGKKEQENLYLPVADVGVLADAPEAEPEDIATALETLPVVAADTLDVAVDSPATELSPAMAELAVAVAPAEAGQLAADGNFTLTLCRVLIS